MQPGRTA
jgi:transposase